MIFKHVRKGWADARDRARAPRAATKASPEMEAPAQVAPPNVADQLTEAGLKIYETERRDEQNTAALIVAVTTGTLAYFAAASAYLADEKRLTKISPDILIVAPFPLLILTGYVTFQYAASRVRQSYLMKLEATLSKKPWDEDVNFPGYVTLHQGIFAPKGVLWPFAALTVLTLISHVIIVVGFTGYAAYVAHREGASAGWFWFLVGFYTLMIIVNTAAAFMVLAFTFFPSGRELKTLRRIAVGTVSRELSRWAQLPQAPVRSNFIGSAWVLRKLPPWATGLIALSFVLIVGILRLAIEGRYYDYALSSLPGDFLIAIELALIGRMLRDAGGSLPLAGSVAWHSIVGATSLAVGIVLYVRSGLTEETVANSYHNLVVVPILSYSVISTIPVLLQGKRLRALTALVCLLAWLGFFIYDVSNGNLQKNSPTKGSRSVPYQVDPSGRGAIEGGPAISSLPRFMRGDVQRADLEPS
ncbi:hypothetical protein [Kitasatospora sp. NPDC088346]|uniref:hypothetical protein n=1 Tax=Kitasatospora sp. NPDC088346 TaxID=3364073 RepID=UPI0037F580AB